MKNIALILVISPLLLIGQYSTYYNIDHNIYGNINQNVNVSGNVNKTITTIDYGALASANAQREANRLLQKKIELERAQYNNEQARQAALIDANRALEIAENPLKAHTYGQSNQYTLSYLNKNWGGLRLYGFYSYTETFQTPHNSLFQNVGQGRFENISTNGITTEIIKQLPIYNYTKRPIFNDLEKAENYRVKFAKLFEYYSNNSKPQKKDFKKNKEGYKRKLNRYFEICDSLDNYKGFEYTQKIENGLIKEKSMFPTEQGDSAYCHKTEVVKRLVCGVNGFRSSLIWEDDYEICITDNYIAKSNGITYSFKVRYKADKNSGITFEDLEGRRFYLSRLVDKTIASTIISNKNLVSSDLKIPKRRNFKNSVDYQNAIKSWEQKIHNNEI